MINSWSLSKKNINNKAVTLSRADLTIVGTNSVVVDAAVLLVVSSGGSFQYVVGFLE